MAPDNRRSFVKKSLATSVSISFTGLLRADGSEGGGTPPGNTTFNPDELSGVTDLTLPTGYTIDQWSAWSIDPVTDPATVVGTIDMTPCDQRNPPEDHNYFDYYRNGRIWRKCTKCINDFQVP